MFRVCFFMFLLVCYSSFCIAGDAKFKVVTTFTVIADMTRNVAGDAATVESITRPNTEIHNYQATPGDLRRAQNADLVIYNGLNLEIWFDKFFSNLSNIPVATITDGIQPLGISQGPYAGKPNPHAWMSASNAVIYIENIRKALVEHDPANASTYNANAKTYAEQVLNAVTPFRERLKSLSPDQRWLVSSEGAFSYLARDFDLKEAYLWPMNADGQGTPQQIRSLIDLVKENNIRAIFSESTVSAKPAMQVARETGASYAGVLYVDSLSSEEGPVPTYIDLLTTTLDTITRGLNR